MRRFAAGMAAMALVLTACGSDDNSADPPESTTEADTSATTAGNDPLGEDAEATLVGTWVGVHGCSAIVEALRAADVEETVVLENVVGNGLVPGATTVADLADPADPCRDAVPREHSHFFTDDGEFGSTDFNGDQVDDGTYEVVDDDILRINGTEFGYTLYGDELDLEPIVSSSCDDFECQWSIMVAMPGQKLVRSSG